MSVTSLDYLRSVLQFSVVVFDCFDTLLSGSIRNKTKIVVHRVHAVSEVFFIPRRIHVTTDRWQHE